MRQWDGCKISTFGISQEHSCDFVFSNNNTTEVSGKVFLCCNTLAAGALPPLGELIALPRPLIGGKGAGPLPKNLTPGVLYSELWSCISKLLDLIVVG